MCNLYNNIHYLDCKLSLNKYELAFVVKSLALAFGTTFAIYMVRALLMFHLKEKLMNQHSREVGIRTPPTGQWRCW